jgi:hypothetical protein
MYHGTFREQHYLRRRLSKIGTLSFPSLVLEELDLLLHHQLGKLTPSKSHLVPLTKRRTTATSADSSRIMDLDPFPKSFRRILSLSESILDDSIETKL